MMKRMIASLMLLGILPAMALARTGELKVDEATVVGTARRIPAAAPASPTAYDAPELQPHDPGLPPERSLRPADASTRFEPQRRIDGTPGRRESQSRPWLWFIIGVAIIGGVAASN